MNMIVWGSIRVSGEDNHRGSDDDRLTSDNLLQVLVLADIWWVGGVKL